MPPSKSTRRDVKSNSSTNPASSSSSISPPSTTSATARTDTSSEPSSSSSSVLPLWLTEGASQRDKNVLCESVFIYTPDGKKELIRNARVQFVDGRHYGLIGANGIGKSTLLKHVYQYILPNFPKYLRVIYVQQHDIVEVDEPVLEWVVQSDEEKRWLETEEERLLQALEQDESSDAHAIQEQLDAIVDRLSVMDARRASTRAAAILTGLGFTAMMQQAPISSLSGGWKQRVALACALFVPSDLLLLDEPTNHLDFGAVRWLEQFLKSCTQTLVLVSHDRTFLNTVSTDIIELIEARLDYYRGDYTSYIKTRDELQRQRQHDYDVQQKKILELKQFIEEAKKSDNPATVNLQKSRQKLLDKIDVLPEPVIEKEFKFEFPDPGKLDHSLVEINGMCFAYAGTQERLGRPWLLKDLNLHMEQTSRIGLLGPNGVGKSTLIKLIQGQLQPVKGMCRLNPHCRAITFTQHHMDQLDLTVSTMTYLQRLFPLAKEHQIRGLMGRFGFDQQLVAQKIGELSGGQKSRVAFSLLAWREPHLLIMDEPTNHLDLSTIEALIHALKAFKGGVLLVSHDQYFLESVANEFWAFDKDGQVGVFYDFEEAKVFSYDLIDYESQGTTNKAALFKQAQLAHLAEKEKNKKPAADEGSGASTATARGKKKRKTKRGGGGLDMAELKVDDSMANLSLVDSSAVEQWHDSGAEEEADAEQEEEEATDRSVALSPAPASPNERIADGAKPKASRHVKQIHAVNEVEEDDDSNSSLLETKEKKKKKKKKKLKAKEENEDGDNASEEVTEKKKKKKKVVKEEEDVADEADSLPKEKKKKSATKEKQGEPEEVPDDNAQEAASQVKRKKSKLKQDDQKEMANDDAPMERRKQKKNLNAAKVDQEPEHRGNKDRALLDAEEEEHANSSELHEKEKKKKKKKTAPSAEVEADDVVQDHESQQQKRKKKQKSVTQEEEDVADEADSLPKEKKKKKKKAEEAVESY